MRPVIFLVVSSSLMAGLADRDSPSAAPPGMVLIQGGTFRMGSDTGLSHETPVHEVRIASFYMDAHEVTNADFAGFVAETGYVTEAERWTWSLVFAPQVEGGTRMPGAEWWLKVEGADWRNPEGPNSSIKDKDSWPVVQVSWNDAVAYCDWAGKRLPTEAEWEFAARGGRAQNEFAWGDAFKPNGMSMANTWQGHFPAENSGEDGHSSLAPVATYPANAYGLYDIAGNVWEWCQDWYHPLYYRASPDENPEGPASGVEKVQRGGSWLCAPSYCKGYRVAHRDKNAPDTGLTNVGFRCVKSVASED